MSLTTRDKYYCGLIIRPAPEFKNITRCELYLWRETTGIATWLFHLFPYWAVKVWPLRNRHIKFKFYFNPFVWRSRDNCHTPPLSIITTKPSDVSIAQVKIRLAFPASAQCYQHQSPAVTDMVFQHLHRNGSEGHYGSVQLLHSFQQSKIFLLLLQRARVIWTQSIFRAEHHDVNAFKVHGGKSSMYS